MNNFTIKEEKRFYGNYISLESADSSYCIEGFLMKKDPNYVEIQIVYSYVKFNQEVLNLALKEFIKFLSQKYQKIDEIITSVGIRDRNLNNLLLTNTFQLIGTVEEFTNTFNIYSKKL